MHPIELLAHDLLQGGGPTRDEALAQHGFLILWIDPLGNGFPVPELLLGDGIRPSDQKLPGLEIASAIVALQAREDVHPLIPEREDLPPVRSGLLVEDAPQLPVQGSMHRAHRRIEKGQFEDLERDDPARKTANGHDEDDWGGIFGLSQRGRLDDQRETERLGRMLQPSRRRPSDMILV